LPSVVTADNLSDGLPVALVEAAAMSLPIVTTDVGGIPELIQHNVTGLVVPQRDAAALAAAIGQLLDDPGLCARLGGAARRRVEQEFSREVNGPRLVEALKPHLGAVDPA
jgi:glycosyltransferase involved in cell wall biosynthesis